MSKIEDYIKEKLKQSASENFGKRELGQLSNWEHSRNLAYVFVKQAMPGLGYLQDEDIDEVFDGGYCDGSNDLGIDLLIRIGNQTHIIQTKFVGFNNSPKRDWIDTFHTILPRIANKSFDKHTNARLSELLAEVNWKSDSIYLWFVTNRPLDDQSLAASTTVVEIPEKLKTEFRLSSERITYQYIDQQKLYEALIANDTPQSRQGVDEVRIFAAKQSGQGRSNIISIEEKDYRSAIMVVEATQLTEILKNNHQNLFDFNIRNYLGGNKKNKAMLETADTSPEEFFMYNNGVSAVCEDLEIDIEKGFVKATRFSIINGAQTVRTLSKVTGPAPKVMFRVTEIANHTNRNRFLKNVVQFNNTQNEIKTSDFRSNDLIQISFEEKFSRIKKGGKSYKYFPKRSEKKQQNTIRVSMPEFAQAVFCYLFDPYHITGQGSGILFDLENPTETESYYSKIFGMPDESIEESEFLWKAGVYFFYQLLDQRIKEKKKTLREQLQAGDADASRKLNAIERKTTLMGFVKPFLVRLQSEDESFNLETYFKKLALDKVSLDVHQAEHSEEISFAVSAIDKIIEFAIFQHFEAVGEGRMTQRQWIRGTEGLMNSFREKVRIFPGLTDRFVGKYK